VHNVIAQDADRLNLTRVQMSEAVTTYFNDVQRKLHEMNESANLSADERDVVDDYEQQGFGSKECAQSIAVARRRPDQV